MYLESLESRQAPYSLSSFGPWTTLDLTYCFVLDAAGSLPGPAARQQVADAFTQWANVVPLHFTETSSDAVIQIHFNESLDAGVLGQAYYPGETDIAGDIFFSSGLTSNGISSLLFEVATHEIGHAIGLAHSDVTDAVMFFQVHSFNGLHQDDVAGAQALYGVGTGSVTALPGTTDVPEPYSPFPGFSGSIETAQADVNRDGAIDSVVLAQRADGHVKVTSDDKELLSVFAFEGYKGDVSLAAGGSTISVVAKLPDSFHVKVYEAGQLVVSQIV